MNIPRAPRCDDLITADELVMPLPVLIKMSEQARPKKEIKNPNLNADDLKWKPVWQVFNMICGDGTYKEYPDKVNFASWVAHNLGKIDLEFLDLRKKLEQLVKFIKENNQMDGDNDRKGAQLQ